MSRTPDRAKLARELRAVEPGEEFEIAGRVLLAMETDHRDGASVIESKKFVDDAELTIEVDDATDVIAVHAGGKTEIIG